MKFKYYLELAASAVVVAGIPLFFFQQHLQDINARIDKSIQYSLLFQSDAYAVPRLALLHPWLQYDIGSFRRYNPPRAVIDKFVKDIVDENPNVITSIERIDEFYHAVLLCSEGNVCDLETASRLLSPFARDIYCLYMPAFESIRESLAMETFGKGLQFFAERKGECT